MSAPSTHNSKGATKKGFGGVKQLAGGAIKRGFGQVKGHGKGGIIKKGFGKVS